MKSKNCVLVCVTPQSKCEQLIRSGSLIAQQYGVPLEVLSVFHERDGFSPDPAVLEDLYECAKNENAQMSGSGPTVFGLFESESDAEKCRAELEKSGLVKSVHLCKTADRGVETVNEA